MGTNERFYMKEITERVPTSERMARLEEKTRRESLVRAVDDYLTKQNGSRLRIASDNSEDALLAILQKLGDPKPTNSSGSDSPPTPKFSLLEDSISLQIFFRRFRELMKCSALRELAKKAKKILWRGSKNSSRVMAMDEEESLGD